MPTVAEEPSILISGVAMVQSVDIQILESLPLQVIAIVRGQLPDAGCTTISAVDQIRDGITFKMSLTTTTDPLALCAQALTPFERVISLNGEGLPSAEYTVNINGIEQTFELLTRDLPKFKQELVTALNAQDHDLLRALWVNP